MGSERRHNAATAGLGYGLVTAGGAVRGGAVDDAHAALGLEHRLKPASLAVARAKRLGVPNQAKIVRRFATGSALVTVGAPAAAVGTVGLLRRHRQPVAKAQQPNLLTEGVQGTGEAWKQKAASVRSGAPPKLRAQAVAIGAGGAALGSLAAHRGLDQVGRLVKVSGKTRAAVTTAAAVPGAVATLPLSRRLARRHGYTVTPTGTHKLGVAKAGSTYKHNDYLGRHVEPGQQRMRVLAAGGIPLPGIGPLAAARQAGRYAPPGHERRAEARQFGGGPVAGVAAGLYTGKKTGQLAAKSPRAERAVRGGLKSVESAHGKLPPLAQKLVPLKSASHLTPKAAGAVAGFAAGHALVGSIGGQVATNLNLAAQRRFNAHHPVSKNLLDNFADRVIGGVQQARKNMQDPDASEAKARAGMDPEFRDKVDAFTASGRREAARGVMHKQMPRGRTGEALCGRWSTEIMGDNARHGPVTCPDCLGHIRARTRGVTRGAAPYLVHKALDATGMTDKQKGKLVRRKRFGAAIGTTTAGTGLTALSMVGSKVPATIERRNKLLAVGAGLSGVGALNGASVARREAKAEKSTIAKHDKIHLRVGAHTKCGRHLKDVGHTTVDKTKVECSRCKPVVSKSSPPIQTTMKPEEARALVHGKGGYGLTGPLPSHLDRPTRMKAYEARYVASGGKKSQRWQHIANAGSNTATIGLAGATGAGLALIGTRSPGAKRFAAAAAKRSRRLSSVTSDAVKEHAERTAVGSATAGGVGQLVNQGAKRRRSKYTSAPGGVAASNLRRMQAYS